MTVTGRNSAIGSSTSSILRIIVPLVLSSLSANLMFLIDRFVLAYYSIDSMNAAMMGGNLAGIYCFVLICIAGTTEVFVGQYNGAGKADKIAVPVWQMIYMVLFSLVVVIPLGYFTKYLNLIPEYYAPEGITYQKICTYFCWVPALTAAFTGFFVGRGKTKIITAIVVTGSLVNLGLDVLLVFGYKNIIPAMGCKGAAIATIFAEFVQVFILACAFWSEANRSAYHTHKQFQFNRKILIGCLKIGAPMAFGKCAEMLAWYLVYAALSHVSKELATIQGITITIYCLFAFIGEGLTKGTAAISANCIGRHDLQAVTRAFQKLIFITLLLCFAVMSPLLLCPDLLFRMLNTLARDLSPLYPTMRIIFKLLFLNVTLGAICAIPWGVLLSGGDTKYPNVVNLLCIWGFVVLPVGILFFYGRLSSVVLVHFLSVFGNATCLTLVYLRYKTQKWYRLVAV